MLPLTPRNWSMAQWGQPTLEGITQILFSQIFHLKLTSHFGVSIPLCNSLRYDGIYLYYTILYYILKTTCLLSGLLPAPHYGCLKSSDQVWTQSTWCLARTTNHQCPQGTDCTQSCFLGSWLLLKSQWQVVRLSCISSQLPLVTWGLYGRLVKPPPH